MKNKFYFVFSLIILFISCDQDENLPPSDFAVSAELVTKNSAQITWTQSVDPEGDPVTYEVRLQGSTIASEVTGNNFELLNLTVNVEYTVEVIAVDAKGNETAANATFRTIKDNSPSEFTVSVGQITKISAQLTWTQASSPNGEEVNYSVQVHGVSVASRIPGLTYKLLNLKPDVAYEVDVTAYDDRGNETNASISFNSLGGNNEPPSDFVASVAEITKNSAKISWTQATDADGDSVKYLVRLQGTTVASGINDISYKLSNLTPDVEYTVEIIAVDGKGHETSTSTVFKTLPKNIFTGNVYFLSQTQVDEFGLKEYDEIHGSLFIVASCPIYESCKLPAVSSLAPLKTITRITSALEIIDNTVVINIDGLSNLKSVGSVAMDRITINENPIAFNNIDSVKGSVFIRLFKSKTAGGFANLKYVGGKISLFLLDAHDLTEFQNLTYAGGWVLGAFKNLTNLNALSKLSRVNGNFEISDNPNLTDFCGLNTLITTNGITGTYKVIGNAYNPTVVDFANGNCNQ